MLEEDYLKDLRVAKPRTAQTTAGHSPWGEVAMKVKDGEEYGQGMRPQGQDVKEEKLDAKAILEMLKRDVTR